MGAADGEQGGSFVDQRASLGPRVLPCRSPLAPAVGFSCRLLGRVTGVREAAKKAGRTWGKQKCQQGQQVQFWVAGDPLPEI